ncbi:MAG: thioredoxin family protein [Robiginitalea sp.]|uniref:thioredoxin family protein n=1 Tax=Robiginitalea sp. TaxID=1902411 RepID=UPI003C775F50
MLVSLFCLLTLPMVQSQQKEVKWMSFEQLENALAAEPRRVLVDFYADWCAYCRKMDEAAFRDPEVVAALNTKYYAVRMNVETRDTIYFSGVPYVNREAGNKRNPVHEIPLMLASRAGEPFTLPAVVLLDESFQVRRRYFEYLSPERMRNILR